MRFLATTPPLGSTPARGPTNLVFVTRKVGFVATTGGKRFVPRAGDQLPSAPGTIERTGDGGITWRTLWHGPVSFDALSVKGDVVVAAGMRLPETGAIYHGKADHPAAPRVLLVSVNGGRTWSRRGPLRIAAELDLLTPRIWLAFRSAEPDAYPEQKARLLRSDDAGLHWQGLSVPRGAEVVRFASPLIGFASADAQSCPRPRLDPKDFPAMQLWRTTDGGRSWKALPATCGAQSSDADIDVVSPQLIFAVQSGSDREGISLVRRSTDGGRTWKTIYREPKRGVFQVHFADIRHGFIVEDERHNLPYFGYTLVASTRDGGRTWTRHGIPADLPVAFYGNHIWVGHDLSGVVWHTANGGKSWRLTTSARFLDPGGPDLIEPHGPVPTGHAALVVSTGAGPAESTDEGRTWTPARWPTDRATAISEGTNAYVVYAGTVDKNTARLVTSTGSRRLQLPKRFAFLSAAAFTTARDGAIASEDGAERRPVFVTHDGGRRWQAVPLPRGLSYSRPRLGPGIILLIGDARASVTVDEGKSWQPLKLHKKKQFFDCAVSRPSTPDVWITCNDLYTQTIIFKSSDGGRTWARHVTARILDTGLLGTGGPEAWVTAEGNPGIGASTSTLWRTRDGGVTWMQVWVTLKPNARALQIDCAISMSGVIHQPFERCR